MKNKLLLLLLLILGLNLCSCSDDDPEEETNDKTLIIFLPWSTTLYNYFLQNIEDMKTAIQQHGLNRQRVLVFLCSMNTTKTIDAKLFELRLKGGKCVEKKWKTYTYSTTGSTVDYMTESGLTQVLQDMVSVAPAREYSMIFGCHGLGWIPASRSTIVPPNTRWVGGDWSFYQTEISTLGSALANNNIKLNYLLFDDCYMSNLEIAYELRNVTHYLIASPTEMMNYGMPYDEVGTCLLGEPDYSSLCQKFLSFYEDYSMPYGTLGITNTDLMDELAAEMKGVNATYTFNTAQLFDLQAMDGFDSPVFCDFEDYLTHLVTDASERERLLGKFQYLVPYKVHTEMYWSDIDLEAHDIRSFSGVTISDPSTYSTVIDSKKQTSWWISTH